jgi:hypothetical protein
VTTSKPKDGYFAGSLYKFIFGRMSRHIQNSDIQKITLFFEPHKYKNTVSDKTVSVV